MRCPRCGGNRPDPGVPCSVCGAVDPSPLSGAPPGFLVRYPDGHVRTDSGQPWTAGEVDPRRILEAPHPWSAVTRPLWDYDLLDPVGRGSAGVVFRAWTLRLGRVCAVKTLGGGSIASATELRRFQNEAVLAARLDHPAIVRVFDAGEDRGQPYLVMEFLEGGSFASLLQARTEADLRRGVEVLAVVARAIHHAHLHGIVHRDLKPDNILLDREGRPHVGDFGLAVSVNQQRTQSIQGQPVGTPWYMSPEQARGDRSEVGPPTDIYSLGATLYHLLAGQPPFSGPNALAVLMDVVRKPPPDPEPLGIRNLGRPVPRDLKAICQRAMEKNPARRYQSALALAEDLEGWVAGRPVSVRPWSLRERWVRHLDRYRETWTWAAVLLTAVLMTVSLFGSMLVISTQRHREELLRFGRTAMLDQTEALEQALRIAMLQGHPTMARELIPRTGHVAGVSRLEVLRPDGSPAGFLEDPPRAVGTRGSIPEGISPEEWQRAVHQRQVVVTRSHEPGQDARMVVLRPILNRSTCRICHQDVPEGQVIAVMLAEKSLQGEDRRLEATRKAFWTLGLLLSATALSVVFTVARLLGLGLGRPRDGTR